MFIIGMLERQMPPAGKQRFIAPLQPPGLLLMTLALPATALLIIPTRCIIPVLAQILLLSGAMTVLAPIAVRRATGIALPWGILLQLLLPLKISMSSVRQLGESAPLLSRQPAPLPCFPRLIWALPQSPPLSEPPESPSTLANK